MKYLICQDWKNTKGNHAGMVHLCKLIYERNPKDYKLIIVPDFISWASVKKIVSFQFKIQPYIYNLIYLFISLKLLIKVKKGDSIFLIEYLLKERNQYIVAKILRYFFVKKITIYGLAHLTPIRLDSIYTQKELLKYTTILDYNLTLGSSLTNYLISKGINREKVITTFHYVDNKYYFPNKNDSSCKTLTVIIMGMQMRDFSFISEIVRKSPDVKFILCSALLKIENYFDDCNNIEIKGFMPESELKAEMNKVDISLNLMADTVGSNVITTSMAMSLVNIVSDVGSIKDYCTNENSFFCNKIEDYLESIKILNNDRKLLKKMKNNSLQQSKLFQFENFYSFINKL